MSKTNISNISERDEVIGEFEYHGFRNILENDIMESKKTKFLNLFYCTNMKKEKIISCL